MLNGTVTTYEQNSLPEMANNNSSNSNAGLTVSQQQQQQQQQRRQSISLNAVINHRRALLGAFLTRVGSNVSLPTCVPQETDFLTTQNVVAETNATNSTLNQKSMLLQLAPLPATTTASLVGLDVQKEKIVNEYEFGATSKKTTRQTQQQQQHSELMSSIISTLYANLLVVVGVAVPVTASVSQQVPKALDQGFYLYLYMTSVVFVVAMYGTLARDKALKKMIVKHVGMREKTYYAFAETSATKQQYDNVPSNDQDYKSKQHSVQQHCGSFCLRLGTVGFGAGSLVLTGLQIGAEIASEPLRAIVPGTRLLLVTAQMHFIFLNSRDLVFTRHEALAKLGLMHLIATNICEWLKALVEETRCEIVQLERARAAASQQQQHQDNNSNITDSIHRKLLRDASPFLFPCTIEFSLICAVILYEMWRRIDERGRIESLSSSTCTNTLASCSSDVSSNLQRSTHQLSIDCGSAHRGLFGGVLIIAATVLSLIMFFVLKEAKPMMAVQQVTSLEVAIQIAGTLAAIGGGFKLLRELEHVKSAKPPHLDATLLAAAQAGVYLHSMFGAVGSILTQGPDWLIHLTADILALLQSTLQTILIKIAWRRRSRSNEKPGKELITFLIVVNIAMWTVNTMEKSRAGVRPDHLEFFGVWAWTIITHVSMPLAIFYRFHSAICLFEVWKSCYKFRPNYAIPGTFY